MKFLSMLLATVAVALLCVVVGCGSGVNFSQVQGTVKVNGKPMEKIQVEFWPLTTGPRSIGVTDSQGRFELTSDDGKKKGASVGSHKVVLKDLSIMADTSGKSFRELEEVDVTQGRKPRIANEYYDPEKSGITKEVVAGQKNDIEIDAKAAEA